MHTDNWIEAPSGECYEATKPSTIDKLQELRKTIDKMGMWDKLAMGCDWTDVERQMYETLDDYAEILTRDVEQYRLTGQDRERAQQKVRKREKKQRRDESRWGRYENENRPERSTEMNYGNADQQNTAEHGGLVQKTGKMNDKTDYELQQNTDSALEQDDDNEIKMNDQKIADRSALVQLDENNVNVNVNVNGAGEQTQREYMRQKNTDSALEQADDDKIKMNDQKIADRSALVQLDDNNVNVNVNVNGAGEQTQREYMRQENTGSALEQADDDKIKMNDQKIVDRSALVQLGNNDVDVDVTLIDKKVRKVNVADGQMQCDDDMQNGFTDRAVGCVSELDVVGSGAGPELSTRWLIANGYLRDTAEMIGHDNRNQDVMHDTDRKCETTKGTDAGNRRDTAQDRHRRDSRELINSLIIV